MSDSAVAQARRLYMHSKNDGRITAMDMSRLVASMELLQSERNRLFAAVKLAEEMLRDAGLTHGADAMLAAQMETDT
jgi:hypothetical protein